MLIVDEFHRRPDDAHIEYKAKIRPGLEMKNLALMRQADLLFQVSAKTLESRRWLRAERLNA